MIPVELRPRSQPQSNQQQPEETTCAKAGAGKLARAAGVGEHGEEGSQLQLKRSAEPHVLQETISNEEAWVNPKSNRKPLKHQAVEQ